MTFHLKEKEDSYLEAQAGGLSVPAPWAGYIVLGCPAQTDGLAHCLGLISLGAVILIFLPRSHGCCMAGAWRLTEAHHLLPLKKGV